MSKSRPNWLLQGLIAVSLAIHIIIFMHVSGIYRSNALSYIELTMQGMSKPHMRNIPRPRHRPKTPQPQDVRRLNITQRLLPSFKPIKMEPAEKDLPDSLVDGISIPEVPATPGLNIVDWGHGDLVEEASGDYVTSQSYLEMVRLKIEKHKEYPGAARARQNEGRVTMRFVITPEGHVHTVNVVKTSGHKVLDTAAFRAVKDAAPFPKPPRRLFSGEIPLEITIVFELT